MPKPRGGPSAVGEGIQTADAATSLIDRAFKWLPVVAPAFWWLASALSEGLTWYEATFFGALSVLVLWIAAEMWRQRQLRMAAAESLAESNASADAGALAVQHIVEDKERLRMEKEGLERLYVGLTVELEQSKHDGSISQQQIEQLQYAYGQLDELYQRVYADWGTADDERVALRKVIEEVGGLLSGTSFNDTLIRIMGGNPMSAEQRMAKARERIATVPPDNLPMRLRLAKPGDE